MIQGALDECFGAGIGLRFETAPGLICGIELMADGRKVGWNLAEYMASLEAELGELLKTTGGGA